MPKNCQTFNSTKGSCESCLTGYYRDITTPTNECIKNPMGCIVVDEKDSSCLNCENGYDLIIDKCVLFVMPEGCLNYDNIRGCLECSSDYNLAIDNTQTPSLFICEKCSILLNNCPPTNCGTGCLECVSNNGICS